MRQLRFTDIIKFMRKSSVFAVCIFALCGCSMELDISQLRSEIVEVIQQSKTSNKEVVPASQQGVITAAGYRVQSSVSYYGSKPEVTTSVGYKVRTNVQSTLFKE
jgi:hypothetical protein